MRTCQRCGGSGKDILRFGPGLQDCSPCKGTGKVPYPIDTDEFDEAAADEKRDFNGDW